MKKLRRSISTILVFVMLLSLAPLQVFADAIEEKEYSISNGYLTYTINNKTGGFSIVTADGHPQKKYDDNIPLLYKEDRNRSNGTSFTTVRIDGKDYIFGQNYGWLGLSSMLHEPVVSEEGRLLTVQWDINSYSVIQKIALSVDPDSDTTGNVGISYQVINNSAKAGNVGIRVLFDTALGNSVDSPYVTTDTKVSPQLTEKEYTGEELPQQIRFTDSLSSPTKMAYMFLKGWNDGVVADKIIVGHWANLANTKYDYTADLYCDFTNYSNRHRIPDSAIAVYWSESTLPAGRSRTAEMLYGVGNFSSSTVDGNVGIDIVVNKVTLSDDKKGYANDGEFDVTVNLDNSLTNSNKLMAAMLTLSTDPGLTVIGDENKIWTEINKGETKTVTFKVKAEKQTSITSKAIHVSVSATGLDGNESKNIVAGATRHILLPAVTGMLPDIQMNSIRPGTVYPQGEKTVTIQGKMNELSSLKGSVNWDMYLVHTTSSHEVRIEKSDISFIDDTYTSLGFKIREDLSVGEYKIVFRLRDPLLAEGFGTDEITAGCMLNVVEDKKYQQASYGILALVRHDNNQYKFITFSNEADYMKFYRGEVSFGGIKHDFREKNTYYNEILLIIRGHINEMEKEGSDEEEIYYRAAPKDGPITINNVLTYESNEPLIIKEENGKYLVEGDGKLRVINSITFCLNEWSIKAEKGSAHTLSSDRYYTKGNPLARYCKDLNVSFSGTASSIIQSIAGFITDIKFGVLGAELQEDQDKSTTYIVSFGGTIGIPIKAKKEEEEEAVLTQDQEDLSDAMKMLFGDDEYASKPSESGPDPNATLKKDTIFSNGQLGADIREIRYGQKAEVEDGKLNVEGTGFIGIDTNVKVVLPQDVMGKFIKNAPGIYADLTINTIKNIYEIGLGVQIKVLECQGIIRFKEVTVKNSEKIIPDSLQFYIRDGLLVPVYPPSLYMTGIGGGIDNLAATIGGDSISGLPPLTLLLYMRLELIRKMIGDFDAAISLEGMSLNGSMKFKKADGIMELDVGISAMWVDPWYVKMYGRISIIDGLITGGVTITLKEDYFYGYINAALHIPKKYPLVGGKELNGIEAAVCNDFIAANFKILGIKYGIVYFWDGDYRLGTDIDIEEKSSLMIRASIGEKSGLRASLLAEEVSEQNTEAFYGTNIHPLTSEPVSSSGFKLRSAFKTVTRSMDPTGQDALLFEIPYTGFLVPKAEDITITTPNGDIIELVEDDGNGGGNFLVQDRDVDGKYIYVTVTNKALLQKGDWTLTVKNDSIDVSTFSVSGVDNLPELTGTSYVHTDKNSFELDVSWTTDLEYDEDAVVDIYLTEDGDALERIKTSSNEDENSLGTSVARVELDKYKSGNCKVVLPDTFENGTYYVVTTITSKRCGISLAISDIAFEFENLNLPQSVKAVDINYGGNGNLWLAIEDADTIGYTDYLVNIVSADGAKLDKAFGQFAVGEDIFIGKEANLIPGKVYYVEVQTLREANGRYYYSTDTVTSQHYTMPEPQKPRLLSVTTNAGQDYLNSSRFSATYQFDRPVWMVLKKNSEPFIKDGVFRDTWTFEEELNDGNYIIDFTAYSLVKDSVTGADFTGSVENAQLGFVVDTQPPVLSLAQKKAESFQREAGAYISTAFSTNVVFADHDGKFTVSGITEADANLTVDGRTVTIDKTDGTFSYSGIIDDKTPYMELMFNAVDKAGNTSTMLVYAVNQKYSSIDSIKLKANGNPIAVDSDGVPTLNIKKGDTINLSVVGLAGEEEIIIDDTNIQWHILYEKGLIDFDEGQVTAHYTGTTAVRAKYISGQISDDILLGPEGYVVINSIENDKSDLKAAIDIAKANLAASDYASRALKTSYQDAINAALDVYNDPNSSDDEISQAAAVLKLATASFDKEKNKSIDDDKKEDEEPVIPAPGTFNVYYSMKAEKCENGKIEFSSAVAKKGTSVTITVTPDNGYRIHEVFINGVSYGNRNVITIASIEENITVSAVFREIWQNPFVDVKESDWFYNWVEEAYRAKLFLGTSENTFEPYSPMTRAMLVTVLGRLHGVSPDNSVDSGFKDVKSGSWYAGFVAWAKENGIVHGIGDDIFAPGMNITREQIVVMLYRYAKFTGMDVSEGEDTIIKEYEDFGNISDYALTEMQWAVNNGIINGVSKSELNPKGEATRAEVATMLVRFMALMRINND